jgi:phosphatidylinositol 4-kinase
MQEPEIFEQPVASKDPETPAVGDDNGTYGGTYGETVYSNGVGTAAAGDDESDDYRDFVFPEGWSLRCATGEVMRPAS